MIKNNLTEIKRIFKGTWGIYEKRDQGRPRFLYIYDEITQTFRDENIKKTIKYEIIEESQGIFQLQTSENTKEICAISEDYILLKENFEYNVLFRIGQVDF